MSDSKAEIAIITGGEPTMYDLSKLSAEIQKICPTHIETSGVYDLTGMWDWICFSPKKFKKSQSEIYKVADELKIVIYHKSDFEWAVQHAIRVNEKARLSLQPEWSKAKEMMPLIVNFVKKNPKWRISLQTHRFLQVP